MSRLGSPPAVSRRVAITKPKNDVFVALLAIALGAMIIACILLALEMNSYEWTVNPKVSQGPPQLGTPAGSPVAVASNALKPVQDGIAAILV